MASGRGPETLTNEQGAGLSPQFRAGQLARTGSSRSPAESAEPQDKGEGQGKSASDASAGGTEEQQADLSPAGLSEEQRRLAESAEALSQRLAELSGKDPRVSFRYSGMVKQTAELWSQASESAAINNVSAAGRNGALGISLLRKVVTALEVIYGETSPPGDFAAEEYPKAFEAQITDYLRRLSYAE